MTSQGGQATLTVLLRLRDQATAGLARSRAAMRQLGDTSVRSGRQVSGVAADTAILASNMRRAGGAAAELGRIAGTGLSARFANLGGVLSDTVDLVEQNLRGFKRMGMGMIFLGGGLLGLLYLAARQVDKEGQMKAATADLTAELGKLAKTIGPVIVPLIVNMVKFLQVLVQIINMIPKGILQTIAVFGFWTATLLVFAGAVTMAIVKLAALDAMLKKVSMNRGIGGLGGGFGVPGTGGPVGRGGGGFTMVGGGGKGGWLGKAASIATVVGATDLVANGGNSFVGKIAKGATDTVGLNTSKYDQQDHGIGNTYFAKIPGLLKKIPGVLGYAQGGVVPGPMGSPSLAMVHGGETVLPAGAGGGITVNVSAGVFSGSEQDARRLVEQTILPVIREHLRTRSNGKFA